jgi:DNA mismatch endonuclease (patch repair protein)
MSKVRSKGNKTTELRLIAIFSEYGIKGWRRNYPVKGHPDFVFPKRRVAVFVDGCFWHGHDCRNTHPKQNEEFWSAKQQRNKAHDKAVTEEFERRGWTVIRIWECELKKKNLPLLLMKIGTLIAED